MIRRIAFILLIIIQLTLTSCSGDNTSIKVKIKNTYDVKTYIYKSSFFGPSCEIITNVNKEIKIDCYYDRDFWGHGEPIVWDKSIKSFKYYPDSNILEGNVNKKEITKGEFIDEVKDAISHYNNQYIDIFQNNEMKETTKATWD
jgi:hypothetical protein